MRHSALGGRARAVCVCGVRARTRVRARARARRARVCVMCVCVCVCACVLLCDVCVLCGVRARARACVCDVCCVWREGCGGTHIRAVVHPPDRPRHVRHHHGVVHAAATLALRVKIPGARRVQACDDGTTTGRVHVLSVAAARRVGVSLLRIPVISSIACCDQRLSYSMRGSMEPRIEQLSC